MMAKVPYVYQVAVTGNKALATIELPQCLLGGKYI